jgi:predicted enzyme related to lactoylglutathione lyase
MKTAVLPLALAFALFTPARSAEEKPAPQAAARKIPSLRRPGFVFMELNTKHIEEYVAFFGSVMDFRETVRKGRYVVLQTDVAELTIMDPELLPTGHPFHQKLTGTGQGMGVEIGFVVADVDKAYAATIKHEGWKISSGIARHPWGARDFRVLSPDGYYLRFTERSE